MPYEYERDPNDKEPGTVLSVRPKVAELAFQLYGRSLHPELFAVHKSQTVSRGGYSAKIDITSAGHVVTWRYDGLTLTEVAASAQHPLPRRRRLMSYRLQGRRVDQVECCGGVSYHVDFQLEPVDTELFWTIQQEMVLGGNQHGLLHNFDSSGRIALGAISYINVETRDRSMRVQAVHTFPDDCALVKSESFFRLP